jgi:hypothetical protein
MRAHSEQFVPDRRGNRLELYEFRPAVDGQSHRLYLRTSPEIAAQFQVIGSTGARYTLVSGNVDSAGPWTHCLQAPGHDCPSAAELADLLGEVITLPGLPGIEFAIALDWYKVQDRDLDARDWRNTLAGNLVYTGKYRRCSANAKAAAGRMLGRRVLDVARKHPVLASADVVVAVPGHDRSYLSFGERLAAHVANGLQIPLVEVATRREFRPPAKELPAGADRALRDEFSVAADLTGSIALVVDDVFRSGGTMSAVGSAAVQAGARVHGLVAVRTVRGQ